MKIFIEKESSVGGKFVGCDTEETFNTLKNVIETLNISGNRCGASLIISDGDEHEWREAFKIMRMVGAEIIEVSLRSCSFDTAISRRGYTLYGSEDW